MSQVKSLNKGRCYEWKRWDIMEGPERGQLGKLKERMYNRWGKGVLLLYYATRKANRPTLLQTLSDSLLHLKRLTLSSISRFFPSQFTADVSCESIAPKSGTRKNIWERGLTQLQRDTTRSKSINSSESYIAGIGKSRGTKRCQM